MNRERAKDTLLEIGSLLDAINLPFFLIQGTALGAYRDAGFVPGERDIDLGVLFEDLAGRQDEVTRELWKRSFHVRQIIEPFNQARTIVADRLDVKIDLVGMIRHEQYRFTATPIDFLSVGSRPYAIVHPRLTMENWTKVAMFGRQWNVPHPIEGYLESEYGPEWKTPKDDSVSRLRNYKFMKERSIGRGYLESQPATRRVN